MFGKFRHALCDPAQHLGEKRECKAFRQHYVAGQATQIRILRRIDIVGSMEQFVLPLRDCCCAFRDQRKRFTGHVRKHQFGCCPRPQTNRGACLPVSVPVRQAGLKRWRCSTSQLVSRGSVQLGPRIHVVHPRFRLDGQKRHPALRDQNDSRA